MAKLREVRHAVEAKDLMRCNHNRAGLMLARLALEEAVYDRLGTRRKKRDGLNAGLLELERRGILGTQKEGRRARLRDAVAKLNAAVHGDPLPRDGGKRLLKRSLSMAVNMTTEAEQIRKSVSVTGETCSEPIGGLQFLIM